MAFFDTPRTRRLKADAEALKLLKENSTIIDYQSFGDPAERYLVTFKGKGLIRKGESDPVEMAEVHRVEIRLGIDYPRSRPDLQWLTSIYHPNISAVGAVCLGGYSTNWVPSLGLAELNETQAQFDLPIDPRSLRDRMTKTVGDNIIKFSEPGKGGAPLKEAPAIVRPPEEDILIIDDSTPTPNPAPRSAAPRPAIPSRPPSRPRPADDDIVIIE